MIDEKLLKWAKEIAENICTFAVDCTCSKDYTMRKMIDKGCDYHNGPDYDSLAEWLKAYHEKESP